MKSNPKTTMTSGEIAKKAGISQKAVRLYDEKGLLKPTDYSEGNYRLYDKAALKVLEKIVALKQIGFSLEEIRDNLVSGQAADIEGALRMQLKTMEEKKYRLEKVIDAINRVFERKSEGLDWDDVAEIVQNVSLDQSSDEAHWDATRHTAGEEDWYVKIFKSLGLKAGTSVLDLGCGYSKLWRNNWSEIPEGISINAYDIHGSWADDFEKYLGENKQSLPKNVSIDLVFKDLEDSATWDEISATKYDTIVAHYIGFQLHDREAFVERASHVLADGGCFSMTGHGISEWNGFFKEAFADMKIEAPFIDEVIEEQTADRNEMMEMLGRHFGRVESVILSNTWHYTDAEEIVQKFLSIFPDREKFVAAHSEEIHAYFANRIEADGEIAVTSASQFWHCGN